MKKTKVVCTVGPSTDKAGTLEAMIAAGMNVARFNFSHGTHADHAARIAMVREAAAKVGKPVALMLDTKGPEMRLGLFEKGKVLLKEGQKFILTSRILPGTEEMASVNYEALPREISSGNVILLADGLISLRVEAIEQDNIITTVLNNGEISDRKRVAVPGVALNLPPLSEQDVADILFGVKQDMDMIAASFVQRAADVLAIRKVLEDAGASMLIIPKIENAEGVQNIEEILTVADGLMVARGDLGVEIPPEEVPLVQKMLIEKCNLAGKPVITATQMLESMVTNPRPTRAEASDVANAILDGTDAIMLSGETASGRYPVEAVAMMSKIAARTEAALRYEDLPSYRSTHTKTTSTDAISHATVQIADQLEAAAVISVTESGYTARMVSKYRSQSPIVAITPYAKIVRQMLLLWGVYPLQGTSADNSDEMVNDSIQRALNSGIIKDGDLVVITAGVPAGTSGTTNMIRVHVVGRILMRGVGIGQKAVTGKLCVVRSASDLQKFTAGDILVISSVDDEIAPYASKASAIVAEEGGFTSNAAIVGISYGIPVIVGVDHATTTLTNESICTVDAARGLVYRGEINVR